MYVFFENKIIIIIIIDFNWLSLKNIMDMNTYSFILYSSRSTYLTYINRDNNKKNDCFKQCNSTN